ncbi:glycoside hydrolase family 55 protein [Paraburkholderia sp. USG1]|uniref:right-handed parallel beta-helix repeat-containing protein n=1 Tax=Paraburkholderia sp. USG1 TaxID=2952268 RepID=UPI00285A663E|nr:right-handed parallel beta-helix repeat-containing protein [Paraburkholderia sp. USG1]MDR8401749.1 glycoside hydrolase family 55 protein [Paraburkholderia sp. USG1]
MLKSNLPAKTLAALLVSSAFLAACGGGGGSDGADATATANRMRRPTATSSTPAASSPAAASSATPASNVISITQSPYNADPTGKTDSTNAIQNALTVAAQNGSSVTIPAGTFVYSNVINVNGIALSGVGKTSILKATNVNGEAIHLTGTGGSLSNFAVTTAANSRLSAWETAMVWIDAAKNFTVQGLTVTGSASAGIFNSGGQGGTIQNNTVQNTLADGITNTNGANGTVISGNLVKGTGDDGISIVSYANAPIVQNITVKNNTVAGQVGGRGLTTVGGSNITYTGNVVDNADSYASLYIAAESEYNTFGVSNVTATGNTFIHGGPSQGTVTVYNSQGSTYNITGVNLSGNQIVSPPFVAFQFVGNGSGSGAIQNSTVYSAQGSSALQNVGNSKENIPVTGTTFAPVAAYTASIAAGGAGATQ